MGDRLAGTGGGVSVAGDIIFGLGAGLQKNVLCLLNCHQLNITCIYMYMISYKLCIKYYTAYRFIMTSRISYRNSIWGG